MQATGLHDPFPARPDGPDERLAITQNGGSRLRPDALQADVLRRQAEHFLLLGLPAHGRPAGQLAFHGNGLDGVDGA